MAMSPEMEAQVLSQLKDLTKSDPLPKIFSDLEVPKDDRVAFREKHRLVIQQYRPRVKSLLSQVPASSLDSQVSAIEANIERMLLKKEALQAEKERRSE